MSETRAAIVPETLAGHRADHVLGELFPDHSRSFLARLVDQGHVRVDTEPVAKVSQRLAGGAAVEVDFPDPTPSTVESQEIPLTILYEDDDIVAVDKPAGLVVHPAAGHPDQTLVNALLFHVRELSGIGGELRPGIVHRLDKDTSGVMLIAKNDAAHRKLTSEWNTEAIRKEYLALVYGTPSPERGTIQAPIGRDPRDRKRMAIVQGGRNAITDYEVLQSMHGVALIRCRLRTGRTHQIRVHMKHRGHPIVGDPLYSGPQWRGLPDRRLQKLLSTFPRQALHAARITIPHPRTGETMTFESPLAGDVAHLFSEISRSE
ncbi:MAG TPA: RluA family pseudouridine synthase [Thermoanaerobaculia bacterium]